MSSKDDVVIVKAKRSPTVKFTDSEVASLVGLCVQNQVWDIAFGDNERVWNDITTSFKTLYPDRSSTSTQSLRGKLSELEKAYKECTGPNGQSCFKRQTQSGASEVKIVPVVYYYLCLLLILYHDVRRVSQFHCFHHSFDLMWFMALVHVAFERRAATNRWRHLFDYNAERWKASGKSTSIRKGENQGVSQAYCGERRRSFLGHRELKHCIARKQLSEAAVWS